MYRPDPEVLAGGGYGVFVLPPEVSMVIARGQGSRIWDTAGREFIDYHLGSGPVLLGHAHPAIIEAVRNQVEKGTTYFFLNEHQIRLAQRLVEAIPCGEVVHFAGSGTEATYFALRIARTFTGRTKIMKFEGGWHGMHDYALWGTVPDQPSPYPRANPDSAGIPPVIGETVLVSPFNDAQRATQLIEEYASDLAAVIVEPLQRVLVPERDFLQALRQATTRHGVVLIFDEVVTGFRIAWGGAQEAYGVVPDLATYGKAMSGGLPMAAIVGRADIMSVLDGRRAERSKIAWATCTLNGNPLCAAAGNAALDVLSQAGTYEHLHHIGSRLRAGIEELGARYGFPVRCPGEDAVFGVRFTEKRVLRNWQDLLTADRELGLKWSLELLRRGLLVNPNEKFYLSLAHTDEDVDRTLQIVEEAFRAIARSR
jgi:glutamate-1-semialdehyde 2,1-aminomutase